MADKRPCCPDNTDPGRKRAHTNNCQSAVPTDNILLSVGEEHSWITDALAKAKGAGTEKGQQDPTGRGREEVLIEHARDSEDQQAATEVVLTRIDVDQVESPEGAEDVVLRLIGNLISDNEARSGPEQPRHDETHAAKPAENLHKPQTSWTITVNGDLATGKSSVALEGIPTKTIPAVLRLVESLSTLLASSSTIPASISGTTCVFPPPTLENPDLSSIRPNVDKATPIIGARPNQLVPAASPDAPFTDAEVRTEINRICAEAGEGIPNRARKEEIKKQYLEGTMKLFGMVAQLKRRGEPCSACASAGQACTILDDRRERVLKAVRCVRCIAGKKKCEDA